MIRVVAQRQLGTLRRMLVQRVFALSGVLSLLAGCGSTTGEQVVDTPAPAARNLQPSPVVEPEGLPRPAAIQWAACAIPSGDRQTIQADCATVDLPARRDVPTTETVRVAVYRISGGKNATHQLWMLNGGPGGAGFSLAPYAELATGVGPTTDVYMVDHRGTGESEFFACTKAERSSSALTTFMQSCSDEIRSQYGTRTDGFSTTESAWDVSDLINKTATRSQKVFVYGGSYGSYWAHRFLQLPGVRVDGMITDGNCISGTCSFDTPQEFYVDEVLQSMAEICKDTTECSTRFGSDPWTVIKDLATKLKNGHCSAAVMTQEPLASTLHNLGMYWASGIPPVLHRLNRCNASDVTVLNQLSNNLEAFRTGASITSPIPFDPLTDSFLDSPALPTSLALSLMPASTTNPMLARALRHLPILGATPTPSAKRSSSTALYLHVVASEMISNPPPSLAELKEKASKLVYQPSSDYDEWLQGFPNWKGYPRNSFVDGWATRAVPWLMLQGTFDFQTAYSLSQTALKSLIGPKIQFVRVDGAGHGVAFASRCASSLVGSFLTDPNAQLDTNCTKDVRSRSLIPNRGYTQYLLGTTNAWD